MFVVNFDDEGNDNVDKDIDKTLFLGNYFMSVVNVIMRAMTMVLNVITTIKMITMINHDYHDCYDYHDYHDNLALFLGNHFMPVVRFGMRAMFWPKADTKP